MVSVSLVHPRKGLLQGQSQAWLGSVFLTPACALGAEVGCWVYVGPALVECTATTAGFHLSQDLDSAGDAVITNRS